MRSRSAGPRAALLLGALLAAGCVGESTPLDPAARAGPLDLSRIVVVGDGFAAGVSDDALHAGAQRASLAALLSGGGEEPLQPLVAEPGFAVEAPDGGRLALVERLPLALERLERGPGLLAPPPAGPYANLGVPRARVAEALTAESEATSLLGNPFFDLVLRGRGTFVDQVAEADPSLVLLWIGAGDVLPWIAAGGDSDLTPGLPTPSGTFASLYERLVDGLLETTDRVVLFTLPDYTELPLTRAIPPFATDSTGAAVRITVQVPRTDPDTGEPLLDENGDTLKMSQEIPAWLVGPDGPLDGGERVTLRALPLLADSVGYPASVGGAAEPLPDAAVLDTEEIALARSRIADYNRTIRAVAAARDLPVVDVEALVDRMAAEGILSDGVRLTTAWLFGQAFGLDGGHFTPKGYGVVANLVIDVLNARYGSRLPHVRTANLPGVNLLGLD